jgi:hypothetical protein
MIARKTGDFFCPIRVLKNTIFQKKSVDMGWCGCAAPPHAAFTMEVSSEMNRNISARE